MLSKISVFSLPFRASGLAAVILTGGLNSPLFAQAAAGNSAPVQARPVQTSQAQPAPGTQSYDPTRPEIQPNLSLDHDPILSPDPEDNLAINPAAPVTNERAGALKKGENGVYTLHQDVDEVLL